MVFLPPLIWLLDYILHVHSDIGEKCQEQEIMWEYVWLIHDVDKFSFSKSQTIIHQDILDLP